jgi:hypothetical protein
MMSIERSRSLAVLPLRRNRLEHDLEPALQVEALARRLVAGRAGHDHVDHAGDGEDDQAEDDEVLTTIGHDSRGSE